jgi:PAS domain S-box-containing protein
LSPERRNSCEELNRRPPRTPDYETENRALVALAQALADTPRTVLQSLAGTILDVLRCGSAGISLVTQDGKRFYWPAIAGVWTPHVGGGTPRDFGPCGDVLDRDIPLMFRHFERRYTYFLPVTPPVEECLLVPFHVDGRAVGTIWAIAHDDRRSFDNEDLRQLVSLARFASSAYQAREALEALERFSNERAGLAAIVESSDDAIVSKTLDGIITSWNHAARKMFGYTAAEAVGQHITLIIPTERRAEADDVLARIRRGERVDHFETERQTRGGQRVSISLTDSPIENAAGNIIGASEVAREITERKRMEAALRDSEVRYRRLFETAHDGILIVDERGEEDKTPGAGDGEHAPMANLPLVRLDGLRVLVVDDEADARRVLARVLHDAGAIVTAAASAGQAIEALSKARQDVLVSDLGMPDVDGFDLIRKVRAHGHHAKDLPAVALTAFAHKNDQRQALLAGFQVHVPKPADPHDLIVVIASLAGRTG